MLAAFSCEYFLTAPFPRLSDILQALSANISAHPLFKHQKSHMIDKVCGRRENFITEDFLLSKYGILR